MTLRTRRKIFVFFIFLFLLVSIGAVYYSRGYRLDTRAWEITRTGSLYIESYERPVSIYLNEKPYPDKSGFLKKGTLISSIIPGRYIVRIEKPGFITYEKNVEIRPSQVARLYYVLLVPSSLEVVERVPVVGGVRIADVNESGALLVSSATSSFILNGSSDTLYLDSYLASLTRNTFEKIGLAHGAAQTLLGIREGSAYRIEIASDTIVRVTQDSFPFPLTDGRYFFGVATSSVSVYDLGNASRSDIFDIPFGGNEVLRAEGFDFRYVFLLANGDVWVRQNGIFAKIAHNAVRAILSPDGYKVLFQDADGPVFAYLMRDEYEALDAPGQSTIRVQLANAGGIESLRWYGDSYHVFVGYPDMIGLAEIIRGEPTNQPIVWRGSYDSFMPDLEGQALFVLQNGSIEKISF